MDFSDSPSPRLMSSRDWLCHIFFGLCMGATDLVPGVSGGSMALILGIYEKFIYSLKNLETKYVLSFFQLPKKMFFKQMSRDFLIALFIGVTIAFATLSQVIQWILMHHVYRIFLFSLFVGMIISSAFHCLKQIKQWKKTYGIFLFGGAAITFILTQPHHNTNDEKSLYHVKIPSHLQPDIQGKKILNYDATSQCLLHVSSLTISAMLAKGYLKPETLVKEGDTFTKTADIATAPKKHPFNLWLICCGAIAIAGMLLPGISGSHLLVILGVYPLAMSSLADFFSDLTALKINLDALLVLGNLMIGVIIGILLFSGVIRWLLKYHRAATMIALVGFMLGALRTVWPFWTHTYYLDPLRLERGIQLNLVSPYFPSLYSWITAIALLCLLGGYFLVFSLEKLAKKRSECERIPKQLQDLVFGKEKDQILKLFRYILAKNRQT